MANQAASDIVASEQQSPHDLARAHPGTLPDPGHTHATHHGRPSSWVAVTFILAGFVCGGLSLVFATWPTFWVGVGLTAIGVLLGAMTNILDDWY